MMIARNILGVIAGYLIFAVSAVLLFKLGGIDPHAEATVGLIAGVAVFGAVFAFVGGFVAKLVAASQTFIVNIILAVLMAGFAAFSLLKSDGSHYTQLAAILIFAPMSMVGGFLRKRVESVA
jgi:hypothetical protein